MKQIKTKLRCINKIEKTVNSINAKISYFESRMKTTDTRVTEKEKSCQFTTGEAETNKKDLKAAKDDIKSLRANSDDSEKELKSLKQTSAEFDTKPMDLESRSMTDNLLFYGTPEGGDKEDCGRLVKNVLRDLLHIPNAGDILFDRAQRAEQRSANTRPVVVKFHYFTDREKI